MLVVVCCGPWDQAELLLSLTARVRQSVFNWPYARELVAALAASPASSATAAGAATAGPTGGTTDPASSQAAKPADSTPQEADEEKGAVSMESHLTTKAGALSMCMVLAALLRDDAAPLFEAPLHGKLAFAMLAEGVNRACRVQLKHGNMDVERFIQRALTIKDKSGKAGAQWWQHATVDAINYKRSGNFTIKLFRQRKITNCSVYAIVSTLGFIELYRGGASAADIVDAYTEHSVRNPAIPSAGESTGGPTQHHISMKGFLHRHMGAGVKGKEAQLALYLEVGPHRRIWARRSQPGRHQRVTWPGSPRLLFGLPPLVLILWHTAAVHESEPTSFTALSVRAPHCQNA